jgi:3-hydroxybutyryl-CoA dehydrogenase
MNPPSFPQAAPLAVLGFGTMGAGIAQIAAQKGHHVIVLEAEGSAIDRGHASLRAFLDGGIARGKVTEAERDDVIARVSATTDVADLASAGVVIEAVVEDPEVKRLLFAALCEVIGDDVVVASNTSAISLTALAATVPNPGRFAGLHFFNPAPLMKLVEVVAAEQTAPETLEFLEGVAVSLGKESVTTRDRPGFLVNRLLMPYLNQVVQAYDDGIASAEDIDAALRLGLGYPMGGLELLDVIGLDTHRHATTAAFEQTHDPHLSPPPLLGRMVDAGYLGRKADRGFYPTKGR